MSRVTEKEIVVDNLLLAYLIERAHKRSRRYLGMTKLQKLIFMVEKIFNERKIKAFNYDFFAWDYGPLSREIYLDLRKLIENDIVSQNENITLSRRGKKLLEDLKEIFQRNREIMECIDSIVEKFADFNTDSLVQYVHDMEVTVKGQDEPVRIGNLDKGTSIMSRISGENAEKSFEIEEAWLETLEILMDKKFCEAIEESEIDAVEGRTYNLQEVL